MYTCCREIARFVTQSYLIPQFSKYNASMVGSTKRNYYI